MKSSVLLFVVGCILLSCKKKEEKRSFWDDFYKTPYVISEKNKKLAAFSDTLEKAELSYELILPYSTEKYGSSYGSINIVFYNDAFYIHKKGFSLLMCGTGMIDLPEDQLSFINLEPMELQVTPTLKHLLSEIQTSRAKAIDTAHHFVFISSLSDTISNTKFSILVDSLRGINPRFIVRRITEEEHHVLDAKTKNISYDPKKYTWTMIINGCRLRDEFINLKNSK